MSESRFYFCTVCGNIVEKIHDSGMNPVCCRRDMEELMPGVTDGKTEWHVPLVTISNNQVEVCVGQNPHPMDKDHYIEWVEIVTDRGIARKWLHPNEDPKVCFKLADGEDLQEVYAYCNKHKLFLLSRRVDM